MNLNDATLEAAKLQNADKLGWERFFNEVASVESFTQLQAIFKEYKKLTGTDVETATKKFFKGDTEECYLAMGDYLILRNNFIPVKCSFILTMFHVLVKIAKNRSAYFAELLYKSMKGLGTSDKELIRIVVSRCEKDMVQIKEEFERMYKETLVSFIKVSFYSMQ